MDAVLALMVLAIGLALYFIPSIIAFSRNISARWSVLVINAAFGWTVIGWIGSLAWSVSGARTAAA